MMIFKCFLSAVLATHSTCRWNCGFNDNVSTVRRQLFRADLVAVKTEPTRKESNIKSIKTVKSDIFFVSVLVVSCLRWIVGVGQLWCQFHMELLET